MSRKRTTPGGRATIRDVAERAGVSVATVSRVLAGTYPVAPATRARVTKAVAALDYVVNAHARALSGHSAKTVAILVSAVDAAFYAKIAQGVEDQAAAEGRLCLICTTGGDPDREMAILTLLREQHADAVILVGAVVEDEEYRRRMAQVAGSLHAAGSRLVLVGRPSLGPDVPAVTVEYDNSAGAYALTSHLLSQGHERILYLGGAPGHSTAEERIAGYRRALAEHGIAEDPALQVLGMFGRPFGYDAMRRLLAAGPPGFTAVFGSDDLVAAGAMQALREAGLSVPQDISMVGYNDISPALDLRLTTVHIPSEELGRQAVRLALHSPDLTPHVVLGTHVVIRDSVRSRLRA
ncbi:LacI family DNA-binding transcriptional regulator [Longispora fulva]|uniref:LacI family transcriptional regulator n=1 Tax=Longispora fulva TaxID=619741 RepID=A0A8J7GQA7_9ACTN|nr:LacI family DNA-binding transcriptional regulator [Longispora fulva]MBG6134956.1 LacI family transcriptional regulator [Longispora fulva]